MILTDGGSFVALIDAEDTHHARCMAAAKTLSPPFLTTLPCFTEALYLLGRSGGYSGQAALWEYRRAGVLRIAPLSEEDLGRAAEYMTRYQDAPCDFADASLLAVAEREDLKQIFTLDGHFYAYRLTDGSSLDVIPGPIFPRR